MGSRLEARITTELHLLLKRAAELQNRTLTDFVIDAAREAAERAIKEAEVIRLSMLDQERFVQALLSPAEPAPALARAFKRHRELITTESE